MSHLPEYLLQLHVGGFLKLAAKTRQGWRENRRYEEASRYQSVELAMEDARRFHLLGRVCLVTVSREDV